MNEQKIRIKQYDQAADEKVSLGGIRWERKWDVCVQCDSREEAERVKAALTMKQEQTTGNVLMDAYHAMQAKKEAAQPKQEPVAWMCSDEELCWKGYSRFSRTCSGAWNIPVYTTPPRREWVGLTEEEKLHLEIMGGKSDVMLAEAIEAKLKEKNT